MERLRFTPPPTISSTSSERSTRGRREIYATERAKILFGAYRRGDANDPETYVASIAAVLAMYPEDLIREVTDPRTGISTEEKFQVFPPNSGELKAYCEAKMARAERLKSYAALPPPLPRLPAPDAPTGRHGSVRAPSFVRTDHDRYKDMVERHAREPGNAMPGESMISKSPGIWVPTSWITGPSPARRTEAAE